MQTEKYSQHIEIVNILSINCHWMGFLSPASSELCLKAPNCFSLGLYDWMPTALVIWVQSLIYACCLHSHLAKEISQYKKLPRHEPFWPVRQTYEQFLNQTLCYTVVLVLCTAAWEGQGNHIFCLLRTLLLIGHFLFTTGFTCVYV